MPWLCRGTQEGWRIQLGLEDGRKGLLGQWLTDVTAASPKWWLLKSCKGTNCSTST